MEASLGIEGELEIERKLFLPTLPNRFYF